MHGYTYHDLASLLAIVAIDASALEGKPIFESSRGNAAKATVVVSHVRESFQNKLSSSLVCVINSLWRSLNIISF